MDRFLCTYRFAAKVLICSFYAMPLFGYANRADSLKRQLSDVTEASRVKILNEISRHYWYSSFDSSIKYGNAAREIAESKKMPVEWANALNNLGVAYDMRGEYAKALSFYFRIIKMSHELQVFESDEPSEDFFSSKGEVRANRANDNDLLFADLIKQSLSPEEKNELLSIMGKCYSNMGVLYGKLSQFNKSMQCFRLSALIRNRLNDKLGIAVVLLNLGNVYMQVNNLSGAQQSYREAMTILKNLKAEPSRLAGAYLSLSDLKMKTNELDSARFYLQMANETYARLNKPMWLAYTYIQFSNLHLQEKNYTQAIDVLNRALEILIPLKDKENEGIVYNSLGKAHAKIAKYGIAEGYFKKALSIGQSFNYKAIEANALLELSELNEKQGQPAAALGFFKEYVRVNNWLFDQKLSSNLSQQQYLFDFEMIEKDQQLQQNERALRGENMKRQQLLKGLFFTFSLIFLFLGIILLFLYRKLLRANSRLRDMNTELEEKVSTRTNELRETLKIAEESNRIKNTFLTNLSHEIRTPLNGIIGFTSLLEQALLPDAYETKYIKEIKVSSDRLMAFLNDLIDLSQAEANRMKAHNTRCSMQLIAQRATDRYRKDIDEKALSLHTSFEHFPDVIADGENIQRILNIVLSNAVKYTDRGSIAFSLTYKEFDSTVEFSITDTGIGIDSEYLPYIFEPFLQESTGLSRLYQGAGLGLALAKRIVSLLNGTIDVNSRKGSGTSVFIKIPVTLATDTNVPARLRTRPESNVRSLGPRPKKAKVLIVEENTYTRFYLQSMLKKHFNVHVARDGNEALSIIDDTSNASSLFDVIIADSGMKEPWSVQNFFDELYRRKPQYRKRLVAIQGDNNATGFNQPDKNFWIEKPLDKLKILDILFAFQRSKRPV